MSLVSEEDEIERVVTNLLNNVAAVVCSKTGRAGADLRKQVGKLRTNFGDMLVAGTFADELLAAFTAAGNADVSIADFGHIRKELIAEVTDSEISIAIIDAGIQYCLAAESRAVVKMEFRSRDDVDIMIKRMKQAFDEARDKVADAIDSSTYQALTFLAGAMMNHLANVARPLPRMMRFSMRKNYPSLALSHRIYYVATRAEELVAENKIIHPAFCLRDIRGLSS
jgi:hypothetical protein